MSADLLAAATWLWIPITLFAAAAQTVRNAVQRSVTKTAGVLPAAFIRFFYGLPFAILALALTAWATSAKLPAPNAAFIAWVLVGAVAQVVATAFFVAAMTQRSFVVSVVFSKTEVLQVGIYSIAFLGESLSLGAAVAIVVSTTGVILLSAPPAQERVALASWLSKGALLGLGSGAFLALASVGYRGAMLELPGHAAWLAGAYGLVWAQSIQTVLLGAWLVARDRPGLAKVLVGWRASLPAGLAGALASLGWFTAFALRSAVDVRIVGLAEILYSYVISRRFFEEHVSVLEIAGMALVVAGIVLVSLGR